MTAVPNIIDKLLKLFMGTWLTKNIPSAAIPVNSDISDVPMKQNLENLAPP